jgi:hypothetical protein
MLTKLPVWLIAFYFVACTAACWRYVPRLLAFADRPLNLSEARFRFEFLDMYALVAHGALLYYLLLEPQREYSFARMAPGAVAQAAGVALLLIAGWLIGVRFLSLRTPKSSLCRLTFLILIPPPACAAISVLTALVLLVVGFWVRGIIDMGFINIVMAIPFTLIYGVFAIPAAYVLGVIILTVSGIAISIPSSMLLFETNMPPPPPNEKPSSLPQSAPPPPAGQLDKEMDIRDDLEL